MTSSRMLEHETSTLPIEIYLKQRRLQYTGLSNNLPIQQTISTARRKIKYFDEENLSKRDQNRRDDIAEWTLICSNIESKTGQKVAGKNAAFKEWSESWTSQKKERHLGPRAQANPDKWNAANLYNDKKTGRLMMNYRESPIQIHQNLSRAQSSIATQVRSEHIGLNAYLYRRNVPGVGKPCCQCGYPSQNIKHMVMSCPRWAKGRGELLRKLTTRSFEAMVNNVKDVTTIAQWIQKEGWLEQFLMTGEIEALIRRIEENGYTGQGRNPHWQQQCDCTS